MMATMTIAAMTAPTAASRPATPTDRIPRPVSSPDLRRPHGSLEDRSGERQSTPTGTEKRRFALDWGELRVKRSSTARQQLFGLWLLLARPGAGEALESLSRAAIHGCARR